MPFFSVFPRGRLTALLTVIFALPVFSAAQQPTVTSLSDEELISQYRERCQYVLDHTVELTDPNDLSAGNLYTLAVNLHKGTNLDWVRTRLVTANQPPSGAMFWMLPMIFFRFLTLLTFH